MGDFKGYEYIIYQEYQEERIAEIQSSNDWEISKINDKQNKPQMW